MIYTSAGSQREVARRLGISHQKVGRLLRTGQPGGYAPDSRVLSDPGTVKTVQRGFAQHTREAAKQARADGLPFDPALPIYQARMIKTDGNKGDRVEAPHLHWISDKTREAWLNRMHKTGKFYAVSVGSVVNFKAYNRLANAVNRGRFRDEKQAEGKRQILRQIKEQITQGLIQTPYTPFEKGLPFSALRDDMRAKLTEKHAPATGDDMPGTKLATRVLFQVDTRQVKTKRVNQGNGIKTSQANAPQARGNTKRRK